MKGTLVRMERRGEILEGFFVKSPDDLEKTAASLGRRLESQVMAVGEVSPPPVDFSLWPC